MSDGFLVSRSTLEPNKLQHGTDTARILTPVIQYILFRMEGKMVHYAVEPNFRSLDLESNTDLSGASLVGKTAGNGSSW